MKEPILQVINVSHSFSTDVGELPILKNVNFAIQQGEMVAIQGPSGSGKSTLLYLLGCLMKVQKGDVRIQGHSIVTMNEEQLAFFRNREIGFVFQQFHLLPRANLLKNILLPTQYPSEIAEFHPDHLKKAKDLSELLGLGDRSDHMPNQLSGGQQQRVAIARALMNGAEIILADEPTGNLDSKSSAQIIDLLKSLNKEGKTVVIITHDNEVAAQCERVIRFKDGMIEHDSRPIEALVLEKNSTYEYKRHSSRPLRVFQNIFPMVVQNIARNKSRSLLTMFGIIVGIASVLGMVTLGQFTKARILGSYADLGVNTLLFYGYPNSNLSANERTGNIFRFFDIQRDLDPLYEIFPAIKSISPSSSIHGAVFGYGGGLIDNDATIFGLSEEGLLMSGRQIVRGRGIGPFDVEHKNQVCLIGQDIVKRLFKNVDPLGEILQISNYGKNSYCRVIGILSFLSSNKAWRKPNLDLIVPYTVIPQISSGWWTSQIYQAVFQIQEGYDIEHAGKSIKAFFEQKYGKSIEIEVSSDSILVAQMRKFLGLFTLLLAAIAFLSLTVGGIGITNMMLVSVSERLREIGLRKALGATDRSVRTQFLLESVLLCVIAGIFGMVFGFVVYESAIFGATYFVAKLKFVWVFDWFAIGLSVVSIFAVGVISGIVPAIKAQKLQVIEALRVE